MARRGATQRSEVDSIVFTKAPLKSARQILVASLRGSPSSETKMPGQTTGTARNDAMLQIGTQPITGLGEVKNQGLALLETLVESHNERTENGLLYSGSLCSPWIIK